jgi:hypothetical protein
MKTKGIITGLLAIAFLSMNVSAIAQNDTEYTAYQKRVHELAEKYYCIVHYNTNNPLNITLEERMAMEILIADVYDSEKYEKMMGWLLISATGTMTLDAINTLNKQMIADLESAKKLMTDSEIQKEKEFAQKKAEQAKIKAERDRAEAERQKRLETDRGRIENLVEETFNKWCVKGEYEKTTDYDNRLKTYSIAKFDSICYKVASIMVKNKEYKIIHGNYDADNETLPITLMIYSKDKKNHIVKSNFTLKIPLNDARDTDFSRIKANELEIALYNDFIVYKKVTFEYLLNSVFNREGGAQEMVLAARNGTESKAKKAATKICGPFDAPLENMEDIIIYSDNLTLNSPYLAGHSYNYTQGKKMNTTFDKYKNYFKNKNEFTIYFQKGDKVFYEELKIRQLYEKYKPTLSATATLMEFNVMYRKCNKNEKELDEAIEYYKKIKANYLQKAFLGDEKKYYSLFYDTYIISGNKKGFESEVSRLYYYNTNKDLYASEDEFNELYKSCAACAKNDIEVRKYVKKYKYDIRKLSKEDHQILVTNSIHNYDKGITSTMDKVIEGDNAMYKEFQKNASYYSNTKEFFNSYIGDNYKNDLKIKQKSGK